MSPALDDNDPPGCACAVSVYAQSRAPLAFESSWPFPLSKLWRLMSVIP